MLAVGGGYLGKIECAVISLAGFQFSVFRNEFHPLRTSPFGCALYRRRELEKVFCAAVQLAFCPAQPFCRRDKFYDNVAAPIDNAASISFNILRESAVRSALLSAASYNCQCWYYRSEDFSQNVVTVHTQKCLSNYCPIRKGMDLFWNLHYLFRVVCQFVCQNVTIPVVARQLNYRCPVPERNKIDKNIKNIEL